MTLLLEEMSEKDTVPYLINANFLFIFRSCQHERMFQKVLKMCIAKDFFYLYMDRVYRRSKCPRFLRYRKLPLTAGVLLPSSSREIYALSSPLE